MIEINIATNGEKVLDSFKKKNTNLKEVAVTLLRLKQIEQELIDAEFDDKLHINEDF